MSGFRTLDKRPFDEGRDKYKKETKLGIVQ